MLFRYFYKMKKKAYDYDCPIDATLSVIGGKWKASCVYYLLEGPKRYTALFEVLETVSSRILSKQLKELEQAGIIKREVFPESPPKVVYSVTEYGKTLAPVIKAICDWGEKDLERTGKTSVYN